MRMGVRLFVFAQVLREFQRNFGQQRERAAMLLAFQVSNPIQPRNSPSVQLRQRTDKLALRQDKSRSLGTGSYSGGGGGADERSTPRSARSTQVNSLSCCTPIALCLCALVGGWAAVIFKLTAVGRQDMWARSATGMREGRDGGGTPLGSIRSGSATPMWSASAASSRAASRRPSPDRDREREGGTDLFSTPASPAAGGVSGSRLARDLGE